MTTIRNSDHPYYAQEGNFFANDCHTEFDSWQEFMDEEGDSDMSLNLVYRWDWHVPEDENDWPGEETLKLYFIGQRKALARSVFVKVNAEDEPAVINWLLPRARHLRGVWYPLLDSQPDAW